MKRIIIILLAIMASLWLCSFPARALPKGAVARVGKGGIGEVAFSPDGAILAVATSIGLYLYGPITHAVKETREKEDLESHRSQEQETLVEESLRKAKEALEEAETLLREAEKGIKMTELDKIKARYVDLSRAILQVEQMKRWVTPTWEEKKKKDLERRKKVARYIEGKKRFWAGTIYDWEHDLDEMVSRGVDIDDAEVLVVRRIGEKEGKYIDYEARRLDQTYDVYRLHIKEGRIEKIKQDEYEAQSLERLLEDLEARIEKAREAIPEEPTDSKWISEVDGLINGEIAKLKENIESEWFDQRKPKYQDLLDATYELMKTVHQWLESRAVKPDEPKSLQTAITYLTNVKKDFYEKSKEKNKSCLLGFFSQVFCWFLGQNNKKISETLSTMISNLERLEGKINGEKKGLRFEEYLNKSEKEHVEAIKYLNGHVDLIPLADREDIKPLRIGNNKPILLEGESEKVTIDADGKSTRFIGAFDQETGWFMLRPRARDSSISYAVKIEETEGPKEETRAKIKVDGPPVSFEINKTPFVGVIRRGYLFLIPTEDLKKMPEKLTIGDEKTKEPFVDDNIAVYVSQAPITPKAVEVLGAKVAPGSFPRIVEWDNTKFAAVVTGGRKTDFQTAKKTKEELEAFTREINKTRKDLISSLLVIRYELEGLSPDKAKAIAEKEAELRVAETNLKTKLIQKERLEDELKEAKVVAKEVRGRMERSWSNLAKAQKHLAKKDAKVHKLEEELEEIQNEINSLFDQLKEALEAKEAEVRAYAAQALGNIGDLRAVEPLIGVLGDEDGEVQREAVRALVEIGEPSVEPLIEALGDENPVIRANSSQALGEIGDARAVEPLIKALEDKDARVRVKTAEALGKIGDVQAIEPLEKLLKDEDPRVQEAARKAIEKIKSSGKKSGRAPTKADEGVVIGGEMPSGVPSFGDVV